MAINFRGLYKYMVPSWLYEGEGEAVLHALSLVLDAATQRMRDGLASRFPAYAGDSALALLGRDRGVPRGKSEARDHYAARLTAWRYPRGHRTRGSAFALLEQVSEYWGKIAGFTIDPKGNYHERSAAGVESFAYGWAWQWDDTSASSWSRFWLVFEGSTALASAKFSDVQAMRRLLYGDLPWRPAGTQPEWFVWSTGPLDASTVVPSTLWRHWSVISSGHQVPTRAADLRYWSLDPLHNNTYAGLPGNFAGDAQMPDGTTYAGDPASFPADAQMPDGTTYAGDPASFPASVRLLDDGDLLNA